jgi:4-hydroxy-3-methylbut-2-en-1-yl diphosphate reductase
MARIFIFIHITVWKDWNRTLGLVGSSVVMAKKAILVAPRGFCAGVARAVKTVENALDRFGSPVYVRKAIVHNRFVVERLEDLGVVFVNEVEDIPRGSVAIFSAHGVPLSVHSAALSRGLKVVIDATCPLVSKVHREVRHYINAGYQVVLVGHSGHDEVLGTLGQAPGQIHLVGNVHEARNLDIPESARLACVTQTTLSLDEVNPVLKILRERHPTLVQPPVDDICFATRNRQIAARWLAEHSDLVLVFGDPTSSNANRLQKIAAAAGTPAILVENIDQIPEGSLVNANTIGITAGASTPENVVSEAVAWLVGQGAETEEVVLYTESVSFPLPPLPECMPPAVGPSQVFCK